MSHVTHSNTNVRHRDRAAWSKHEIDPRDLVQFEHSDRSDLPRHFVPSIRFDLAAPKS